MRTVLVGVVLALPSLVVGGRRLVEADSVPPDGSRLVHGGEAPEQRSRVPLASEGKGAFPSACQDGGSYPLYCTEAEANAESPDGKSHEHRGYHMPWERTWASAWGVSLFNSGYEGDAPACDCDGAESDGAAARRVAAAAVATAAVAAAVAL